MPKVKDADRKIKYTPRRRKSIAERFWAKVDKSPGQGPNGECHEWQGGKTSAGYGTFWGGPDRGQLMAHRVSFELTHDTTLPEGLQVRHSCDNPPCVRGDHLALGTHATNMLDMWHRGRRS